MSSGWIAHQSPIATLVTNRDFRKFVEMAGYVTFAEIAPDPKDYPGQLKLGTGCRPFSGSRH
jgi:formylglycine-generating enzyme required for sulfatase activity